MILKSIFSLCKLGKLYLCYYSEHLQFLLFSFIYFLNKGISYRNVKWLYYMDFYIDHTHWDRYFRRLIKFFKYKGEILRMHSLTIEDIPFEDLDTM